MIPPMVVPLQRLPPGYSKNLREIPKVPAVPRPAATLALLRKGDRGIEVLLLKRGSQTRFIPGAFVFPGGRVDAEDGETGLPPDAVTALRETYEEVGILLTDKGSFRAFPLEGEGEGSRVRKALHRGEISFSHALKALGEKEPRTDLLTPIGHWVTPVQEPFRYDTRFFAVQVPGDCPAFPDGVELVEAVWMTPKEALRENSSGHLPMVFPTILTLEALATFHSPGEALEALGQREIPRLLPRVESTGDGVRMTVGVD